MAHLYAQVTLGRINNVPADAIVNGFHFETPAAPIQADYESIADQLEEFYTAPAAPIGAPTMSVQMFLGASLALNTGTLKIYNLADLPPRAPQFTSSFGLTVLGGNPLPAEVALVVSLRALVTSGTNPRRRRGRIYLGPMAVSAAGGAQTDGDARPTSNCLAAVAAAAGRLRTYPTGPDWRIFSEADQALIPINEVRVDNAWDIQRRRGAKPTLVVVA